MERDEVRIAVIMGLAFLPGFSLRLSHYGSEVIAVKGSIEKRWDRKSEQGVDLSEHVGRIVRLRPL